MEICPWPSPPWGGKTRLMPTRSVRGRPRVPIGTRPDGDPSWVGRSCGVLPQIWRQRSGGKLVWVCAALGAEKGPGCSARRPHPLGAWPSPRPGTWRGIRCPGWRLDPRSLGSNQRSGWPGQGRLPALAASLRLPPLCQEGAALAQRGHRQAAGDVGVPVPLAVAQALPAVGAHQLLHEAVSSSLSRSGSAACSCSRIQMPTSPSLSV
jgi:hypothetical protein